jgi:putative hydrolase of the HAD superfamily
MDREDYVFLQNIRREADELGRAIAENIEIINNIKKSLETLMEDVKATFPEAYQAYQAKGKQQMVKNVIFDIGRVLIDFNFEGFVEELFGAEKGAELTQAMWKNPDWRELDRGVLSDEEVLKLFISKAPGLEHEIRYTFAKLGDCAQLREGAIELIDRLKAEGFGVYYLSNYFEYIMHTAPWALEFVPHTDGGVFSCREKVTKPDPEIYKILCERYGLVPGECVFIDDTVANVIAAENFGMKGISYISQGYKRLYEQINELRKYK